MKDKPSSPSPILTVSKFNLLDAILKYFFVLTKVKESNSAHIPEGHVEAMGERLQIFYIIILFYLSFHHQVFLTQQSCSYRVQKFQHWPCCCEPPEGFHWALHFPNLNLLSKKKKKSLFLLPNGKVEKRLKT